ncbi:MAG: hypothetical protein QOJ03_558 [Frankiaceae bacterium]|nr:hypothetical protein [Frankiaceae bacterium]
MAQRVQVILVCDVHDNETPGTETITFGLDGSSYEIDVCEQHGRELRDGFARYIGAASRATGRGGASRSSAGGRRRSRRGGSGEAAKIREWARGQGLAVPERGRVPAELAEKYAAAHR